MAYTEDFKHILAKRNQINNANLFVFKNNTPRSMKVFPEEVSNVLLEKYFDTLTGITEENEFVDFIPTTVERGTLQVIGIDILNGNFSINISDNMLLRYTAVATDKGHILTQLS